MKNTLTAMLMALLTLATLTPNVSAEDAEMLGQPHTVAILAFSERGAGVKDAGEQAADLMFASLATNPNIWLVERAELEKLLEEHKLNLSGAVNSSQATKVGQLTGAKIIVTGSVFKVKDKTYLVAKVIGTETSRVLGESENGTDGIDKLADKLGQKVSKLIDKQAAKLMPKVQTKDDIIASMKKTMGDAKRPKVYISVKEEHLSRPAVDPAAQTELQLVCKELGFEVTEKEDDADVVIKGEGFSEFAMRKGDLISVKARLEVKAVDKKGNVLAVDRQTAIEVDLAEAIAGKKALQSAALKLAERLVPKVTSK